jgi:predicted permease
VNDALLLLPDFLLIVAGFAICRYTMLNRPVWESVEQLVYWLLFPVLLFNASAHNPMRVTSMLGLAACGLAVVGLGVVLAYGLRGFAGADARLHASGAQTAFRFNSYVALALAQRVAGTEGVAAIAVLVSVCVPVSNVAAVWPLARHGGHDTLREVARNPLIVGTVAGLACNLAGVQVPWLLDVSLQRIGTAALPLGLMAVGAGLRLGALRDGPRLAAAFLAIRHLVLPAAAFALVLFAPLPLLQRQMVVAFAALPTASSSYVLATRLGGHGSYVAGLITASTLLGMVSLPLALAAGHWLV